MKKTTTAQLGLYDQQLSFVSEPDPDAGALIAEDRAAALLENAECLAAAMCPSLADAALTAAGLAATIPSTPEWERVKQLYVEPDPAPAQAPPHSCGSNQATVGFCLTATGYEVLLIGGGRFEERAEDCPGTTEQHRREVARSEALALSLQAGALYIGED